MLETRGDPTPKERHRDNIQTNDTMSKKRMFAVGFSSSFCDIEIDSQVIEDIEAELREHIAQEREKEAQGVAQKTTVQEEENQEEHLCEPPKKIRKIDRIAASLYKQQERVQQTRKGARKFRFHITEGPRRRRLLMSQTKKERQLLNSIEKMCRTKKFR